MALARRGHWQPFIGLVKRGEDVGNSAFISKIKKRRFVCLYAFSGPFELELSHM